jgi:hypothetical protein
VTAVAIITTALLVLVVAGVHSTTTKLRRIHTPADGTAVLLAHIDADGYHPSQTVRYCADCHSPFPCPTLEIFGIKK